jgi:beta-ketoacyl synthase-like protein
VIPLYVQSVGLLGPGLPDWRTGRDILRGARPYEIGASPQPNPDMLSPNERRRGAKSVRWAVAVAQEAVAASGLKAADIATVFTSSGGDGETMHCICEALAAPGREVSPTRFHNSVHNAAAGYWSIAAGSRRPSVSLCGYNASFAIGLLEAAVQASVERTAVLLVAYDLPYPQPLHSVRAIDEPLAVAVLLAPEPGASELARWRIALAPAAASTSLPASLVGICASNPVAQCLPLLVALARDAREQVRIDYLDDRQLVVEPAP